jgi:hypothetical protein
MSDVNSGKLKELYGLVVKALGLISGQPGFKQEQVEIANRCLAGKDEKEMVRTLGRAKRMQRRLAVLLPVDAAFDGVENAIHARSVAMVAAGFPKADLAIRKALGEPKRDLTCGLRTFGV